MKQMGSSRQKTYKTLFAVLSVLIFIYGMFKLFPIIRGPQIFVDGIKNGENHGPIAFISGKTNGAKSLTLNNNEIILDEDGNFSDTLLLSDGYNIISLSARDGFGRTKIKTFEITATKNQYIETNKEEPVLETEPNTKEEITTENIISADTEEPLTETGTELLN